MIGEMVPFVPLPRFTTYVGAGTYATAPIAVSDFEWGEVVFWRGPLLGGAASAPFTTYFEGSHDAVTWTTIAPSVDTADAESTIALPFQRRWFRVRTVLQGEASTGVVAITLWIAGAVERRNPST